MQTSQSNLQGLATSQCAQCGGAFDFERSTFQETGRNAIHIIGQTIKCPHCGEETVVTIPMPETPIVNLTLGKSEFSKKPQHPSGHKRQFISCPTCSESISGKATSCPKCGHQFRVPGEVNMGDPVHFIGIMVCILFLVVCVVWMLIRLGAF